jgi:hypothetical protein
LTFINFDVFYVILASHGEVSMGRVIGFYEQEDPAKDFLDLVAQTKSDCISSLEGAKGFYDEGLRRIYCERKDTVGVIDVRAKAVIVPLEYYEVTKISDVSHDYVVERNEKFGLFQHYPQPRLLTAIEFEGWRTFGEYLLGIFIRFRRYGRFGLWSCKDSAFVLPVEHEKIIQGPSVELLRMKKNGRWGVYDLRSKKSHWP